MRTAGAPAGSRPRPGRPGDVAIIFGLALLTAAAFARVWSCGFINYDDADYVTHNPYVQRGLTADGLEWAFAFGPGHASNYHPLTWLSLMGDAQLYGLNPRGYHLTSLALHALNVVLLYLALAAMTGSRWRSALAAALFGVHPLRVESVVWIAERKDVLSLSMGLLALLAYVIYARRPSLTRYLPVPVLLALSLLAKPTFVTFPFLLLLLDFWPLGRLGTRAAKAQPLRLVLLEKVPLVLLAAGSCVTTIIAQRQSGALLSLSRITLGQRVANATLAYGQYLANSIWPLRLATPYPLSAHPSPLSIAASAAILLATTALVTWQIRRRPWLGVGWFWFVGALVPMIGLVQVGEQAMADRYTYLPSIGLLIMVGWSLPALAAEWRWPSAFWPATAVALVVAAAALTWRQVGFWQDSQTLFSHALEVTGENWIACNKLGDALLAQGQEQQAAEMFERSLRAHPRNPFALTNLGVIIAGRGNEDQAVADYLAALAMDPGDYAAHFQLGRYFQGHGDLSSALGHYRAAVRLRPGLDVAYVAMGEIHASSGDLARAIEMFRKATRLNPRNGDGHSRLAMALGMQGQLTQAMAELQKALALEPSDATALRTQGRLMVMMNRPEEAVASYRRVLAVAPDDFSTNLALAEVLAKLGRLDEAGHYLAVARSHAPDAAYASHDLARVEQMIRPGGAPPAGR